MKAQRRTRITLHLIDRIAPAASNIGTYGLAFVPAGNLRQLDKASCSCPRRFMTVRASDKKLKPCHGAPDVALPAVPTHALRAPFFRLIQFFDQTTGSAKPMI